jgi:hypothetical protein
MTDATIPSRAGGSILRIAAVLVAREAEPAIAAA